MYVLNTDYPSPDPDIQKYFFLMTAHLLWISNREGLDTLLYTIHRMIEKHKHSHILMLPEPELAGRYSLQHLHYVWDKCQENLKLDDLVSFSMMLSWLDTVTERRMHSLSLRFHSIKWGILEHYMIHKATRVEKYSANFIDNLLFINSFQHDPKVVFSKWTSSNLSVYIFYCKPITS